MPARVDDHAVMVAAEFLLKAAQTIKTEDGNPIKAMMTLDEAHRHVMCALVYSLGHYASNLQPTGWVEVGKFGEK